MNYIVCDDDKEFGNSLAEKIKRIDTDCNVTVFYSAAELLFKLEDIVAEIAAVFLDIRLSDGYGINVGIQIMKKYPSVKIVYVTGYGSSYSQSIFDCPVGCEPLAYILKPVDNHFLTAAIKKIKSSAVKDENVIIKSGSKIFIINPKDIIAITCRGRKLTFITTEGEHIINGRLSAYLEVLPDIFVQVSKSHIINLLHINEIADWKTLSMSDNSKYPITRTYCQNLKELLLKNNSLLKRIKNND